MSGHPERLVSSGGYVVSGRCLTEEMKGADAVPTEGKAHAKTQRWNNVLASGGRGVHVWWLVGAGACEGWTELGGVQEVVLQKVLCIEQEYIFHDKNCDEPLMIITGQDGTSTGSQSWAMADKWHMQGEWLAESLTEQVKGLQVYQ